MCAQVPCARRCRAKAPAALQLSSVPPANLVSFALRWRASSRFGADQRPPASTTHVATMESRNGLWSSVAAAHSRFGVSLLSVRRSTFSSSPLSAMSAPAPAAAPPAGASAPPAPTAVVSRRPAFFQISPGITDPNEQTIRSAIWTIWEVDTFARIQFSLVCIVEAAFAHSMTV